MAIGGRRRSLYALVALVLLVFLAGCVDYPPSYSVCLSCERGIEAAAEEGPDVTVTHSELSIRVREDGSGRWTVRSELAGPGVEELRSDPGLVDRFAGDAVTDSVGSVATTYAIHQGDVRDRTARMDGDAIVISFAVDDMARPGVDGVLLVDYFNTRGGPPSSYELGSDRVIVRGPPGTVVTNQPPQATVSTDGGTAAWAGPRSRVTGHTYVAFGPDRTTSSRVAAEATVAYAVAGWVVPEVVRKGLLFSAVMTVTALAIVRLTAGEIAPWIDDPVGALRALDVGLPPVDLVAVPLALFGLCVAVVADLGGIGYRYAMDLVLYPPLAPLGLFALLGYWAGRNRRVTRSLVLAIGGSPFVMAAAVAVTLPSGSYYRSPAETEIAVSVLAMLVLGPPLYLLARRMQPDD